MKDEVESTLLRPDNDAVVVEGVLVGDHPVQTGAILRQSTDCGCSYLRWKERQRMNEYNRKMAQLSQHTHENSHFRGDAENPSAIGAPPKGAPEVMTAKIKR
ncbi:hypothetical protein BLNAU_24917 [Blattamonas nauphoetae]|uniref:Transposase n=1 Tax=Blattamonas nauphoetae TaxID=2049346 RepID=A0ABQ9WL35_9EUKA|nr:hypothetical protein BLNAU_24917 [Blattamonas nauphoetae]